KPQKSGPNFEKGESPKKGPKFSVYWIYGILLIFIIAAQLMRFSPDLTTISQMEFINNMLKKGDVQRFDIIENKKKI
ncbi:hypothetical protein ABTN73_20705, partial [Acinetobacter baumannii]